MLARLLARPAPIVFVFCLLLGLAAVAWRAKVRANTVRASASAEALARSAAVELQFSHAMAAAEVLGALARQSGGAFADFQKIAAALLTAHPGLASLELQPGGVVSDVAPRAGHERAIGHNTLTDPAQRPGANAAIQSRLLSVSGPLTLDQGMLGIVVRVPVFLRSRDGREYFWGFVAASLRLPEALSRARVNELFNRGYNYAFFAPASAQQKAIGIAASGKGAALQDTVQQSVWAKNVEFRLALQPRAGWVNKTKLGLELAGALLGAGLLCLLVNLLENRHALEIALADANQRLGRETADRKQSQEDCLAVKEQASAAQAELKQTQSARQQAETALAEMQTRRAAADQSAPEAGETDQAQARQEALDQAQQTIIQLQARLDAAAHAGTEIAAATQAQLQDYLAAKEQASAAQAELKQTQSARQQAETALAEMQTRRAAADQSAPEAGETDQARQEALDQAQQTIIQLQARLDTAAHAGTEIAAATQAQLQQAMATIADLQTRQEAESRTAREAAEVHAARLSELEQGNRALETRLLEAAQAEAQASPVPEPQTQEIPTPAPALSPEGKSRTHQQPPRKSRVKRRPPKVTKRKKTRSGNQMDLFGGDSPTGEALNEPPFDPLIMEPTAGNHRLPAIDPELPPVISARDDVVESADGAVEGKPTPAVNVEQPVLAPQANDETVNIVADEQIATAANSLEVSAIDEPVPADDLKPLLKQGKDKPAPARRLPTPPPVNPAQLRKAVNLIVPLLTGQDPGAKDCLKANRGSFRSAFTPEAWPEFEQLMKANDFGTALDQLKKAVKKHGISV